MEKHYVYYKTFYDKEEFEKKIEYFKKLGYNNWTEIVENNRNGSSYTLRVYKYGREFLFNKDDLYLFPFEELEYYTFDDSLEQVMNLSDIDDYIRNLLIRMNENGVETEASCSGLLEDHIYNIFEKEICDPYISFEDKENLNIILEIIEDTRWYVQTNKYGGFCLRTTSGKDSDIYRDWDILEYNFNNKFCN